VAQATTSNKSLYTIFATLVAKGLEPFFAALLYTL